MQKQQNKNQICLTFIQTGKTLLTLGLIFLSVCCSAFEQGLNDLEFERQMQAFIKRESKRFPASFVPNDELAPAPKAIDVWYDDVLVEDESGILQRLRGELDHWQQIDEYAEQWDIKSTGLYQTPEIGARKNLVQQRILRYYDKRLFRNVRKAKEGSALSKVNNVKQALRPNTKVAIGKKVKIKFKARVLRRNADIIIDNPYVDSRANVSLDGEMNVDIRRQFKSLGVNTHINYRAHENAWFAQINKPLTKTITASITSHQSDKELAFSNTANKIFSLSYFRPF